MASGNHYIEIGVDVVPVNRVERLIARWGDRFLKRVLTPEEGHQCRNRSERISALLAGKEACSKALGLGMRGLAWKEMEILHQVSGKPQLVLHRRAADLARRSGWHSWSISLTHDGGLAIAVVVAIINRER